MYNERVDPGGSRATWKIKPGKLKPGKITYS
jgi:hypothetical protein